MKFRRPASIASAVVIALAMAGTHASAAPQGPWVQPAVDLSAIGGDADSSQIAIAPDGTTTAVWERYNGTDYIIQAATRPPGGPFGGPVNLSTTGGDAGSPQIAFAPDGTATAVWARSNGSNDIIQTATRPPGGSFGAPVDLSVINQSASFPQIAIAPDGTATAVWTRFNGSNDITQGATRPPGGSFGAPVGLSASGKDAFGPQIAVAADGTATAVWWGWNGSNWAIQAATRPPGGSFGAPVELSVAGGDAGTPQIAIAPDGTATAVWARDNGSNWITQAATRPPGGSFGTPVGLSAVAVGQTSDRPQIALAPDGTATAVWWRFDGTNWIIQAATRPPGGSFGAPVDLSGTGQSAYEPQIAVAPDGTATAVWRRYNGSNYIIQAATRPPGGAFGAPVDLSTLGENAFAPQIAIAPDGTATTVWNHFNGSNDIIESISTARPSFALNVTKTGSGGGTVTSAPLGIDCGADCSENYLSYTKVTLTATPDPGNKLTGWGGACEGSAGNTCELALLDDQNATATFGKAKLKLTKVKPNKPKIKPGKTVKLKVTAKNTGDGTASNAKLCLTLSKSVKEALKPKGKSCQKLGSIGAGKAKTKAFKLKATGKAKRGKSYQVKFKLTANGAKAATKAVKVKVK